MVDARQGDPPEARREARAARILDAARREFVSHGFQGASMSEICAAAGMSPGNVYRYFRSKDEIVAATCARECAPRLPGRLLEARGALVERLLAALIGNGPHGSGELATEIRSEAVRNPDVARCVFSESAADRAALVEALRDGQGRGEVAASLDADGIATLVLVLRDGLNLSPRLRGDRDVAGMREPLRVMLAALLAEGCRRTPPAGGRSGETTA